MQSIGTAKTSADNSGDRPRRSFLRCLASVVRWTLNLTGIFCIVILFTPVSDWLGDALIDVDPLEKADYIVVLDGNRERAVEAANLYRQGWAPKVIVSSTKNSAPGLVEMVKAYGVPADDILIDDETTRTATHPKTVAQLPEVDKKTDRFIILTSSYHTSRSKACFLHDGYEYICMQSPGWRIGGRYRDRRTDWGHRATTFSAKFYEVLAWAMYRVRGWV